MKYVIEVNEEQAVAIAKLCGHEPDLCTVGRVIQKAVDAHAPFIGCTTYTGPGDKYCTRAKAYFVWGG